MVPWLISIRSTSWALGYGLKNLLRTWRTTSTTPPYRSSEHHFSYKLTSRQTIQLSYNRSIKRPNIYQLNPHTSIDDPYTVSKGNPFLKPEFRTGLFLEYSFSLTAIILQHVCSTTMCPVWLQHDVYQWHRGFWDTGTEFGQDSAIWRTIFRNIQDRYCDINPFLQLFDQYTTGSSLANQYGIGNRHNPAYNSGLSGILSFKHDFSFSVGFQYASPKNDIQGNSFCGALYFLSLDKTIKQKN